MIRDRRRTGETVRSSSRTGADANRCVMGQAKDMETLHLFRALRRIYVPRGTRLSVRPSPSERDMYFIGKQPAPAPHLAHPGGYAALRVVLVTVPCVYVPRGTRLSVRPSP